MVLLSTRSTINFEKTIRQSNILLKLFMCFDIFFLISAVVNQFWFSPASSRDDLLGQYRNYVLKCIIGFFSASLTCNCLAIYGLTSWKRGFILPWLVFYSAVKIFLILAFISNILNYSLNLNQLFLLLVLMLIVSAWRHMQIQFILMGMPRPSIMVLDPESASSENSQTPENDLPPKYEEVAEIPPKYDEATMKPSEK